MCISRDAIIKYTLCAQCTIKAYCLCRPLVADGRKWSFLFWNGFVIRGSYEYDEEKKKTGTIRILCRYLKRLLQSQTVDCFSTFNYIVSYRILVEWQDLHISTTPAFQCIFSFAMCGCTFWISVYLNLMRLLCTHLRYSHTQAQTHWSNGKRNQKQHWMHTRTHRTLIGHLKMRQQKKMWTREYTFSYDGMHKSSALPVEICSSIFCYCFGISHFFSCPECVGGCKIMRAYVTISFNVQNRHTHTHNHLALYRSYCRFT